MQSPRSTLKRVFLLILILIGLSANHGCKLETRAYMWDYPELLWFRFLSKPNQYTNRLQISAQPIAVGPMSEYRYAVAPSEDNDCLNASLYTSWKPRNEKININLSSIKDGPVRLCMVGRGNHADGTPSEQTLTKATKYLWIKDTIPPGSFSIISPIDTVASRSLNVRWTTSSEAESYELIIARDSACKKVELVFPNIISTSQDLLLPNTGIFHLCLQARDRAGNLSAASNSGYAIEVISNAEGAPTLCEDPPIDPTVIDAPVNLREPALDLGYISPSGEEINFFPADQISPFSLNVLTEGIPGETLLSRNGQLYLEFLIENLRIRVVNFQSPVFTPADPPADVVFDIGVNALTGISLMKQYTLPESPLDSTRLVLQGVSILESTSKTVIARRDLSFPLSDLTTCEPNAVYNFALGTFKGLFLLDMPAVRFPPVSGCNPQKCADILTAWIRTHHNVWRIRQMLETVASLPYFKQRSYVWDRPGRDSLGEIILQRSSPSYWFGSYSSDALDEIRTVVNTVWHRMTTLKVGTKDLHLQCPSDHTDVCKTKAGLISHHKVPGEINFCEAFFTLNGRCYGGQWNDETQRCDGGFVVSQTWRQSELLLHQVLHHISIGEYTLQDRHSHGHGNTCLSNLEILDEQYEFEKVRHLATVDNCSHNWIARHNPDNYGFFITTIGDMIYRGSLTQWPAWDHSAVQPPGPCTPGTENCLCAVVQPAFDAPDGDYRSDQWCPDNDGEMTCQKTKFNSTTTVGICTNCDIFRGAGCECDAQRSCDAGFCWGDTTANNRNVVGHCYNFPPPDWSCLADCKRLHNSDAARCYYDHPSGKARCIDGIICEEIEEYNCFQQGKVCFDGDCITECTTTEGCRYDGPPELDLDYPSFFQCIPERRCEAKTSTAPIPSQGPGFPAENFGLGQ